MLVIPAVDIREGRCVRLLQGRPDQETVYSDNPVAVAHSWQDQGARFLHVVDLDGAFAGEPKNLDVIKEITGVLKIPVQVGGGIRTLDTIDKLLNLGVHRVILGTVAINNPRLVGEACRRFGADKIVVGIDSKDGKVAVEGWAATVEKKAGELAREMVDQGVRRVVYTNTSLDGTLSGVDVESTVELARETGLQVIASGGVSSVEDIKRLKAAGVANIEGVILGKSLYSGAIRLSEALAVAEG